MFILLRSLPLIYLSKIYLLDYMNLCSLWHIFMTYWSPPPVYLGDLLVSSAQVTPPPPVYHDMMVTYWGAFWRGVRSNRNILTGNMFLVMRQNNFGHDQDRNFIRVFKYCYFLVNTYLQHVHLLNV